MKKAYSYQRFSSIKQREGDSLKRQQDAAQRFCKQHGLQLVSTMKDEGVSGFKGKNFKNEAALGQFLKLVENGTVDQGSVLIIENMDRLSRESILPCLSKFTDIIHRGVSIGVLSFNKILDEESITRNPMDIMLVLVEFVRANNESETKSVRAKSAIQAKIERVKKGEKMWFGAFEPTWILGTKNDTFLMDADRVKLVKEVFRLYLSGNSCNAIANTLNNKKTPTLRGIKNGIWTNSIVAELLRNKNVIGWFGINSNEFDNYFPAIVSVKDFQDAQDKLAFNVKNRGGSKYGLVRNLFKGLLFCHECGQTVETKVGWYRNVKGTINHYSDYICRGVKQHTGCKNRGRINVTAFELAVFELILAKNPAAMIKPHIPDSAITDLEENAVKVKQLIARLSDMAADPALSNVAELKAKLTQAVTEQRAIQLQIASAKGKKNILENSPIAIQTLGALLKPAGNGLEKFFKYAASNEKRLSGWYKDYLKQVSDTENRKKLRNLMVNVFERLTIKHTIEPKTKHKLTRITCTLVEGKQLTCSVADIAGTYIFQ